MAEEAPVDISAIASPTDVKTEPHPIDGLQDLSMPLVSAFKRPLDLSDEVGAAADDQNDPKRLKTEAAPADDDDPLFEFDVGLLVQNALSNFDHEISGHTDHTDPPPALDVVPTTEPVTTGDVLSLDPVAPAPEPRPASLSLASDPERFVREANLNALASMTISTLVIATHQPLDDLIPKLQDPHSDLSQTVRKLKRALEGAKNIYSPDPVLRPDTIDLQDADTHTILQLANIAQLGAWIMDGSIESIRQGDKYILPMLQDREGGLNRSAIEVWTGIKTHLAMDSLLKKPDELSSEQILRPIFSDSVRQRLAERRSDLQFKEQRASEITAALKARQDEVQETILPEGGLTVAQAKYTLDDMLKPFGIYAREQLSLASHIADKLGIAIPASEMFQEPVPAPINETATEIAPVPVPEAIDLNMDGLEDFGLDDLFEKQTSGLVESALASFLAQENEANEAASTPTVNGDNELAQLQAAIDGSGTKTDGAGASQPNGSLMTDYKELEALVAESTSNYVRTTLQGLSPAPYQPVVPVSTAESMAAQSQQYTPPQNQQAHNPYYSSFQQAAPEVQQEQPASENLPPNQTASSSDLYDKARQAALSKTTSHTRREGSHSTRRPWSQEEEKALMAGLDMVKGPHWSQILTLFGVNGTISDILKDRTQVQLKDKARNLKLFFLKTNSEMPFYLQAVTGELKTRAPTQAARKEAEERARLNSEEDQAKLQGILALAGGLQHPPQNRASGSPVTGHANGTGVTQAQTTTNAASTSTHHTHAHPQMAAQSQASGQSRPAFQTVSQKSLQPATQPQARTLNQLPPQLPRPQTHAQPNSQLHHTTSGQATTQGAAQRPPQPHGLQHTPMPTTTQQPQHPVLHKIQHQVQQRMAAQAAGLTAQRQQSVTTPASSQPPGQMQQARPPQQQQAQSKPQSPALPAAQAHTQTQQPTANRTMTPGQSASPTLTRPATHVAAAQSPTTAAAQRPPAASAQGQPHITTQSSQPARPVNGLHLPAPAQQSPQPAKSPAPLALPKPAVPRPAQTPQAVPAQMQPGQEPQASPHVQAHTAQSPHLPAQTAQRQSPQTHASPTPPPHVQRPQGPAAQQQALAQPSEGQTVQRQSPQTQASPVQAVQATSTPQQSHQAQKSPAQATQPHPASMQPSQALESPSTANHMSPPQSAQQQQSPPQPQAASVPKVEPTNTDDSEMSPEARVLQGLRDALAGASSFDGSTSSTLPQ